MQYRRENSLPILPEIDGRARRVCAQVLVGLVCGSLARKDCNPGILRVELRQPGHFVAAIELVAT